MHGDQIEEFYDARGIDALVSTKTRSCWMLRITQVNQSDRKLRVGQFLIGKFGERGLGCVVDQLLQCVGASELSARTGIPLLTVRRDR